MEILTWILIYVVLPFVAGFYLSAMYQKWNEKDD